MAYVYISMYPEVAVLKAFISLLLIEKSLAPLPIMTFDPGTKKGGHRSGIQGIRIIALRCLYWSPLVQRNYHVGDPKWCKISSIHRSSNVSKSGCAYTATASLHCHS